MRLSLWFLLLFALAVAVTLLARFDAGYVIVVLPPWRLEMSFMLAAVAVLLLFGIAYFVVRMGRMTLRLPADVHAWRRRRRSDKAEDETSRAVAAFLAGHRDEARKLAQRALRHEHLPLAALVAAHAALAEGDKETARESLKDLNTDVAELVAAREAAEKRLAD
jgi:HemY protein